MAKQITSYATTNFHFHHSLTDTPSDIATHIHDSYELFHFMSGDVTYYIEGQAYKLKPRDMIITNTRELHRIVFNSTTRYERRFIQFKPEYVSAFQTEDYNMLNFIEKRKLGYFNKISARDMHSNKIDEFWDKIESYTSDDSPENHIYIKTLFIQMLVKINKLFSKNSDNLSCSFEYDDKIISILDYINKNIDIKLTLDHLEQMFYVNKYYLCHIFKMNTGFTVVEYITYKRITKAQELLCTGIPILEVSDAVGFGDYSNFYKAFKKITGVSPKKYLK
jgi:YesN/AraC family two-component response regulator